MTTDRDKMEDLRVRAEELLSKPESRAQALTLEEVKALVHDLRVHQVELELQNEELRHTQKELQRVTDRYSRLYDHAPVGYLTVDKTGCILQANETFSQMMQIKSYRLRNTSLFDLIHDDDQAAFISRFRAFHKNPKDKIVEIRMKGGNHQTFFANLRGNIVQREADGRNTIGNDHLLLSVSDISTTKQAERQVQEQKHFLETILDGLTDMIALLSPDYTIISFNRAGYEYWRQPPIQVRGGKCFLLLGRDRPCEECAATKAIESGLPETIEKYFSDIDRWFQVRAIPITENGNRVSMVVEQFQDISHRKWAEEEQRKLERELHQAQKMEAIGTLAGGIAHDFNNLLQAINGYIQIILLDKDESHPDYTNLVGVLNAGDRAAELVRQMLLFSRKVEADRVPIDINREIEESYKLLVRAIPKMIEVVLRLGQDLWMVMADAVQFEQVILNLASNAADAMPDGGKLVIESGNVILDEQKGGNGFGMTSGRYVLLTVSDTGHGMTDDVKAHIFEPFFSTKEIGKGTGLGLASVYGIVKSHGGYIDCYSRDGQGTVFKIYLPAIQHQEPLLDEEKRLNIPRGGTENVLLVDDEEAIRDFAAQLLERYGYTVIQAATGEEAIECFSHHSEQIDLVLLDISMPGMGGRRCLQEILKEDPNAKVLVASGYPMNDLIEETLLSGASGYIGKPYRTSDLLNKIRLVFDSGQSPR